MHLPCTDKEKERFPMKQTYIQSLCVILICSLLLGLSGCTIMLPKALLDMLEPSAKTPEQIPSAPAVETMSTQPVPSEAVNPVPETNPFRDYYDTKTGYLLPESNVRYYFRIELRQGEEDWLRLARCEIYARNGYVFEDADLAEYFESMPWYTPDAGKNAAQSFNKYEKHNVKLLDMLRDLLAGKKIALTGTYLKYYNADTEYILPKSNKNALSRSDLNGMTAAQLKLARNEIFARHGYYFSTDELLTYFAFCSWYRPDRSKTSTGKLGMKSVETKNVSVIQNYEKNPDFSSKGLNTKLSYKVTFGKLSLKLPAYWKDSCTVEKVNGWLSFSQKASVKEFGGELFALTLLEQPPEDLYVGWIEGVLENKAGDRYYVYISHPTDVQFDYEDHYIAGEYEYMYDEIGRILNTITGINGYTFSSGVG